MEIRLIQLLSILAMHYWIKILSFACGSLSANFLEGGVKFFQFDYEADYLYIFN